MFQLLMSLSLTMSLAASANAAVGWTTLLQSDCNGALAMMPENPKMRLTMDFGSYGEDFLATINDLFWDEIKTYCPDLQEADRDIAGSFTIENMLSFFDSAESDARKTLFAQVCMKDYEFLSKDFKGMALPETCSYAKYIKGEPCQMSWDMTAESKMHMTVSISQCAGKAWPAMALQCQGDGCAEWGKPCSGNTDCKHGSCMNPYGLNPDDRDTWDYKRPEDPTCPECYNTESNHEAFTDWLQKTGFQSKNDVNSCGDMSNKVINRLLSHAIPFLNMGDFKASSSLFPEMKMCGMPATDDGFVTFFDGIDDDEDVPIKAARLVKPLSTPPAAPSITFTDWIKPSDPDGVTVLYFDCDNNYQIGSESTIAGFRGHADMLRSLMDILHDVVTEVVGCRTGVSISDLQSLLDTHFNVWTPTFWYNALLTKLGADTTLGGATFIYEMMSKDKEDPAILSNASWPDTCNLAALMKGECTLEMDLAPFLRTLGIATNHAAKVRVRMDKCPSDTTWAFDVECIGQGCKDVMEQGISYPSGDKYCSADADCSANQYTCEQGGMDSFPSIMDCDDDFPMDVCPINSKFSVSSYGTCVMTPAQVKEVYKFDTTKDSLCAAATGVPKAISDQHEYQTTMPVMKPTMINPSTSSQYIEDIRLNPSYENPSYENLTPADRTDVLNNYVVVDISILGRMCKTYDPWAEIATTCLTFTPFPRKKKQTNAMHEFFRKVLGLAKMPETDLKDMGVCTMDFSDMGDKMKNTLYLDKPDNIELLVQAWKPTTPPRTDPTAAPGGGGTDAPGGGGGGNGGDPDNLGGACVASYTVGLVAGFAAALCAAIF